jgi:membrane fusion protein, heavy metal efflux system
MALFRFETAGDRVVAVITALALIGVGALGSWWLSSGTRHTTATSDATVSPPSGTTGQSAAGPAVPTEFELTADTITRAGLSYAPVEMRTAQQALRVPGVVEPNAYREVLVTPLVSGRVQDVNVRLGDRVAAGQTLATVFSPDLAMAQTRFLTLKTALETEAARLKRTERLLEIGATSRQEYEVVRSRHAELTTELEGARSQLKLLGMPVENLEDLADARQISSTVPIRAPSNGIIIERAANAGLNVDPGTVMFKVSDLSRVWVIASLYERNLSEVKQGDRAVITSPALGGDQVEGYVSYLDPVVDPTTRTAKARVEVANRGTRLRLKMYVDVTFASAATAQFAAVPAGALQRIGSRAVVYVKHPTRERTFIERDVEPGEREGDYVLIRSGVSEGELVVATGSFSIRAQRERGAGHATAAPPTASDPGAASSPAKELFESYEQLRRSLAENRFQPGDPALAKLVTLTRTAAPAATTPASALAGAANLDDAREHFGTLSETLVPLFQNAALPETHAFLCPMRKRPWAQRGAAKGNPYYGSEMLDCGVPLN